MEIRADREGLQDGVTTAAAFGVVMAAAVEAMGVAGLINATVEIADIGTRDTRVCPSCLGVVATATPDAGNSSGDPGLAPDNGAQAVVGCAAAGSAAIGWTDDGTRVGIDATATRAGPEVL